MNRVKLIRIKKEMTQWQLSLLTGIPQSRISLFENGFIKLNNKEIARIREALEIQKERLLPSRPSRADSSLQDTLNARMGIEK